MIRALLTVLLFWPVIVFGEALPALYQVSGVSEGDTLNVREGPGTAFAVLDKLDRTATGLEVIATDDSGEWGLINTGERSGWVSLKYMRRQAGQPLDGLPNTLHCVGTEPFWSFRVEPDRSAFFKRFEDETPIQNVLIVSSENRTDRHALFGDGGDRVLTSVIGRNLCSDGMSDRSYGLSIDMLVTDANAVRVYSGCCSVLP